MAAIRKTWLLAVITLTVAACGEKPPASPAGKTSTERPAQAVEVAHVEQRPINIVRVLTGTLEAPTTVQIHTELAGRIVDLPYREGDHVAKGAMLARLDATLIQAQLDKAVAARLQADTNLQRLQDLAAAQLASEDELARAHTVLAVAKAEESLQRTYLSYAVIEAPFSGVVSQRLAEPGDIASVNGHILTVFDPSLFTVKVDVPEQLLALLTVGDKVKIHFDSLSDVDHAAEVLRIHPTLDAQTRQGIVEVRLRPVPRGVRPGLSARVTLASAPVVRRTIPLLAVRYDSEGAYVLRVNASSKTERVAVHTGLSLGDFVEVLEGLAAGDRVVVKGFLDLTPGKPVRVLSAIADVAPVQPAP